MWTCENCGESVEDNFEICWSCGASYEGETDPNFVTADEAPVIPKSTPALAGEIRFEDDGDSPDSNPFADFGGTPDLRLVECYWAKNAQEAHFLAEQLNERGIPAVADDAALSQGLGPASFGAPYFSPRIRVRSEDLDRARLFLTSYEEGRRRDREIAANQGKSERSDD
jgi:hypothetical protein